MKWQDIVDSENGYHIDWRNLSHCQQQSYSGLTSPRRILWYYHSNEIFSDRTIVQWYFLHRILQREFWIFSFYFFCLFTGTCTLESERVNQLSFFLIFFSGPVLMDEFAEWYQLKHPLQSSSAWIYCFTKEIYAIEGMQQNG